MANKSPGLTADFKQLVTATATKMVSAAATVVDAASDKRITFAEGVSIAQSSISAGASARSLFKEATKGEIKLSKTDVSEIIDSVKESVKESETMTDDQWMPYIEATVNLLVTVFMK